MSHKPSSITEPQEWIDSLIKDRQMIEGEMLSVAAEIKALQERYKRLDRDRENIIYAINQLDEVANA